MSIHENKYGIVDIFERGIVNVVRMEELSPRMFVIYKNGTIMFVCITLISLKIVTLYIFKNFEISRPWWQNQSLQSARRVIERK